MNDEQDLRMMKVAFAVWDNRIAPVFDVARQIHLVEAEAGQVVCETQEPIADGLPVQKVLRLAELGVGILVCGAISRPLQEMVAAYGIRIIPFVAGDLNKVIQAWLSGNLERGTFAMPGCCRHARRRFKGIHGIDREEYLMNGKRRGGMGQGGGRGQGRGGQRPVRMGGSFAGGPTGYCVCPRCGQRVQHERGLPCLERKCPKCGIAMTRE
jgi:predicted Fe-Mo cluster-binding NifX family protein